MEAKRLEEDKKKEAHWRRWGPYVSERQWGTVREDYSVDGEAWTYFTFDDAKSKAYRWGEDGIAGICDNHQHLCFSLCFWNGKDEILKERLFGLSGKQGNHGEDVKEHYFYLENTPTHSYMRYLYKYPQAPFPYKKLLEENNKQGLNDPEFELVDTGVLLEERYFDIYVEYAKAAPEDIFIKITAKNLAKEKAEIHLLPTLLFRNTWSWNKKQKKPFLKGQKGFIETEHDKHGKYYLYFEGQEEVLFTENETNFKNNYAKDAFHNYVVHGIKEAVNPALEGSKSAVHYKFILDPQSSKTVYLRLNRIANMQNPLANLEEVFTLRKKETADFYDTVLLSNLSDEMKEIQRQSLYGILWNKQFYHYVIEEWLKGDEESPIKRKFPRNGDWVHLYNEDILSVPDKWEYPCFFSWDTAFQTLPLAMIDPEFAKKELTLFTREWYMHPNGQLPAYEWGFGDVNPPVHAWAAWRIFKIEKKIHKKADLPFLESIFQKLLLNFTWWVNRKDFEGKNIFQGGFLGLDNISVFNRSENIPLGGKLYQSDATSWMGMYCLNMLTIALELAKTNPVYEDMASKFYEHFLFIANAINFSGNGTTALWNDEDGFYYDVLSLPDGNAFPLKVRSMVGIIPLFAVAMLDKETVDSMKGFKKRLDWFLMNRLDLCDNVSCMRTPGSHGGRLLSIVTPTRLRSLLAKVLDEQEFLSPYGIRSLSKYHKEHPYILHVDNREYRVDYEPGESTTKLFGGNSNWRGPVWLPLNMLIIESLQKFHHYFGEEYLIECPTGSGKFMNLWDVAGEIATRLIRIFKDKAFYGKNPLFQNDPHFKDLYLFYEYFNPETGQGLGASHQTGWTALIGKLIQQYGK